MLHHYRENSYRKNDEGDRNIKKKLFTETIVTFVTDDRNRSESVV
jgi:hypothetical protein